MLNGQLRKGISYKIRVPIKSSLYGLFSVKYLTRVTILGASKISAGSVHMQES